MTSVWVAVCGLVIGLFVHASVVAFGYGKQTQKTDELKLRVDALSEVSTEHQVKDELHFTNTDMHWDKREREWMNKRFEGIEKMLQELLRRGDGDPQHEYRKPR